MKTLLMTILLISNFAFGQNFGWHNEPCSGVIATVKFINADTGIAVGNLGNGKIYTTTNGGNNWLLKLSLSSGGLSDGFFAGSTMFAVGYVGNLAKFYRSTNYGYSWPDVPTALPGIFESIWMFSSNKGLLSRNYGAIYDLYKTTNGGQTWSPTGFTGGKIKFLDSLSGVIKSNDTLFYSTNSGDNWLRSPLHTASIYNYSLSKNDSIWGISDTIIRYCNNYKNSGTWTTSYQNRNVLFYDIFFVNGQTGWVTGKSNKIGSEYYTTFILKTTNAGMNWVEQWHRNLSPIPAYNLHLYMYNINFGWASGMSDTLLYTTTSGITQIHNDEIITTKYFLSNNYPNPFNPSTKINFSIPKYCHVTIKVYDILGNEIDVLVNHNLNLGNYSIEWNASELPSGIYFYKLETNEFSDSKRMVLIK